MSKKSYVLITPARNEESYIEKTIQAVVSQTILPEKWVIVSDGSTDRTDEIVNHYAARHDFIELLSLSQDGQRNFGAKVNALNAGYKRLKKIDYAFVGFLDADVSFDYQYFEKLLGCFQENPKLGIGGGIILELINGRFVSQNISLKSVAGAIQLFRRNCYEAIGGYIPLELGGIDIYAEVMARKHGWKVQTFPKLKVLHHRRVAVNGGKILKARFRQGIMNYSLGYHPLFQFLRCLLRLKDKPCFVGSLVMLLGYCWAAFRRYPAVVSEDFTQYLRAEQMSRLWPFSPR